MGVHEVEGLVWEWNRLAVGHPQVGLQTLDFEILAGEGNGGFGEIDPGDFGAAAGEANQIDTGAATDFEHAFALVGIEIDEAQQVVQLVEVVLVEIGKESWAAGRVL